MGHSRRLETTPESCRMAVQMAEPNSMDEWIALDAQAAHELLELAIKMRAGLRLALKSEAVLEGEGRSFLSSLLKTSEPWVNPS